MEVLSGGERIRLAFARILIRPPNLLLLDEPTTHLDVESREALQEAIAAYTGTVVLVSHDVAFVRAVAEGIIAVAPGGGVRRFSGGYDYYREKIAQEAAGGGGGPEIAKTVDEAKAARAKPCASASVEERTAARGAEVENWRRPSPPWSGNKPFLYAQLAAAETSRKTAPRPAAQDRRGCPARQTRGLGSGRRTPRCARRRRR